MSNFVRQLSILLYTSNNLLPNQEFILVATFSKVRKWLSQMESAHVSLCKSYKLQRLKSLQSRFQCARIPSTDVSGGSTLLIPEMSQVFGRICGARLRQRENKARDSPMFSRVCAHDEPVRRVCGGRADAKMEGCEGTVSGSVFTRCCCRLNISYRLLLRLGAVGNGKTLAFTSKRKR